MLANSVSLSIMFFLYVFYTCGRDTRKLACLSAKNVSPHVELLPLSSVDGLCCEKALAGPVFTGNVKFPRVAHIRGEMWWLEKRAGLVV